VHASLHLGRAGQCGFGGRGVTDLWLVREVKICYVGLGSLVISVKERPT